MKNTHLADVVAACACMWDSEHHAHGQERAEVERTVMEILGPGSLLRYPTCGGLRLQVQTHLEAPNQRRGPTG